MVTGSFCTRCGLQRAQPQPVYYYTYPQQTKPSDDLGKVISASWALYFGFFFIAVVVYISLLWAGLTLIVPGILGEACADCKAVLLIIVPQPIPILEPFGGIPFLVYYAFVVTTISICFLWLVYKDLPVVITDFKESLKEGWFSSKSKSTLLKIGQLFAFGIFFNIAYSLMILIFLGQEVLPAGTEIEPAWYFLSMVSSAAVWEEIISRTLLIGVPLFIIALLRRKEVDQPLRYFIGGGFEIGTLETTFLVFSAIWFATAHTFSSGPWVFPPLFVGGMILGFLFLRKGIIASILFHFIWNYNIAFNYMAQISGNLGLQVLGVVFTLFVALVGLVVAITFLMKWSRTARGEAQPTEASQPSSATGYRCPQCGWTAATYKDGHFQCVRCGHIT